MYLLFGKKFGYVECLGKFHTQEMVLRAYDEFWCHGYTNLKILS